MSFSDCSGIAFLSSNRQAAKFNIKASASITTRIDQAPSQRSGESDIWGIAKGLRKLTQFLYEQLDFAGDAIDLQLHELQEYPSKNTDHI
ncbi:MAG: hypothetical protein ACRD43_11860, partial [Pyrinomonadaceae bacterium]